MNIQNFTPDVVILSGGDYPSHNIPLKLLKEAQKVVCCDGAVFNYYPHYGKPWRIVGDCDTIFNSKDKLRCTILEQCRDIIRRYEEQDDNDQTKAVRYCLEHGLRRIAIVGATGGREDHTLGNISLLLEYERMGAEVRLYTDHGLFLPCHNHIEFEVHIPKGFEIVSDHDAYRQKSTQISIFNFGAKNLKSKGLRYPLSDFSQWWQGTLNEAISSPFSIDADGDFLIYICFIP